MEHSQRPRAICNRHARNRVNNARVTLLCHQKGLLSCRSVSDKPINNTDYTTERWRCHMQSEQPPLGFGLVNEAAGVCCSLSVSLS